MADRFKRIGAFLVDWIITLFPFFTAAGLIVYFNREAINSAIAVIVIVLAITPFILFALRDVIFKGRSFGKRMFKLYVLDKNSLEKASAKQCFIRDLFFFIYFIDGIILLASGSSIGDNLAGTTVLSKKTLENDNHTEPAKSQTAKKKSNAKTAIAIVAILAVCGIGFLGFIFGILNMQKDSEEYKLAYNYLVTSDEFKEMNVDESKVWMNRYSSSTYSSIHSDDVTQTVEIGFFVNFKPFTVVCEKQDGEWQICEEQTNFD